MGPNKIMIIRHAEKPGNYNNYNNNYSNSFAGINFYASKYKKDFDEKSLTTLGWERAGALTVLFNPQDGKFQSSAISKPDYIYSSSPSESFTQKYPSQRPYQTVSALANKLKLDVNTKFEKNHFDKMIFDILDNTKGTVLISWQHEDILPKKPGHKSIVTEIIKQTNSNILNIPKNPWPESRYDIILVFECSENSKKFNKFVQVPQLLLQGDLKELLE